VVVLKARFENRREEFVCPSEHAVWGTADAIICDLSAESSGNCDDVENFMQGRGSRGLNGFA
jgi:hypothetical protein